MRSVFIELTVIKVDRDLSTMIRIKVDLKHLLTIDVKRDAQTLVLDLPDGLLDVYLGKDDTDKDGGDDDWEVPV